MTVDEIPSERPPSGWWFLNVPVMLFLGVVMSVVAIATPATAFAHEGVRHAAVGIVCAILAASFFISAAILRHGR